MHDECYRRILGCRTCPICGLNEDGSIDHNVDLHVDLIRTIARDDNIFRQLQHIRNYEPLQKMEWSRFNKKDNCSFDSLGLAG